MNSFIFSLLTIHLLHTINCLQRNHYLHNTIIGKRTCGGASFLFQPKKEMSTHHHESENSNFISFISKQSFLRTISSENLRVSDMEIKKSDSFSKLNNRAYGDKLMRLQALRELFPDVNDIPENIDALLSLLKCTELFLSIGGDDRLTINNETQVCICFLLYSIKINNIYRF